MGLFVVLIHKQKGKIAQPSIAQKPKERAGNSSLHSHPFIMKTQSAKINLPPPLYWTVEHDEHGNMRVFRSPIPPDSILARRCLEQAVNRYVGRQDDSIFYEIAAGRAAHHLFISQVYRPEGLTKDGYCRLRFGRPVRTIQDWVASSVAYDDIGADECPVQPTSHYQLLSLKLCAPEHRQPLWLRLTAANGQRPVTGEAIRLEAERQGLLLPVRSKKLNRPSSPPPASDRAVDTTAAARVFAASWRDYHAQKGEAAAASAWTKMEHFLAQFPPPAKPIAHAKPTQGSPHPHQLRLAV